MENLDESFKKPKVFIVDDDIVLPAIIKESSLMGEYEVSSCLSGYKALEKIKQNVPDIFLLDYNMPRMTGVELCSRLKQIEACKDIPVIFLTGVKEVSGIVDAFKAGAIDYIVKPVIIEELVIRIKTHLELSRSKKKIEKFAYHMEQLAKDRAEKLMHADRLATIGTLSAGLAHEIKNPATFISGNIQTLEKFWQILKEIIPPAIETHEDKKVQLQFILDEMPKVIFGVKDGVSRIRKVVDGLRGFSRKNTQEKVSFDIAGCINNALMLCKKVFGNKVKIKKSVYEEIINILGDPQQIEQVLVNLLTNAVDAMENIVENPEINIIVEKHSKRVCIYINDNGPGISIEALSKIWEPFYTTKPAGKGTGLGLPLCRSMIEAHSGKLEASNLSEGGGSFQIILPIYTKE